MRRILIACLGAMMAGPVAAQTLRIGIADDADMLDPTLGRTFVGRIVFASLCDKLLDIDEKLAIVPQLATGYEWTDPVTLVMKLRPNVVFQDGEKFDAAAVKFSLDRHLSMQGSTRRGEIATLDHVDVVDPLTVKLVLKSASSPFLSQLTDRAGMIVSPKAAQALGGDFGNHPVCAGPFKFTERVAQDRIVLEKFADYWNAGAIKLQRVVFRPIPDNTVRLANLQGGALDMAERFQPSDVEVIGKDSKLKMVMVGGLGYQGLTFNIANGSQKRTPMMQDARVRQAFALSIDRAALVQVVYNGVHTPVAQAVPPSSPFYDPAVPPAGRDVARAQALLKEAGVKTPVTVELMLPNAPDQRQTGEVIQSMAAEAGFDVKLRTTEFVTALKASTSGEYETFSIGWSGRTDADGNLYNFVHTGMALNDSHYSSKEADDLLDQARAVTDIGARRQLYGKLAQVLNRDLPIMYLYSPKNIFAMTAKVNGYVPVPDWIIRPQGMTVAP